jgi:hypothetical protein
MFCADRLFLANMQIQLDANASPVCTERTPGMQQILDATDLVPRTSMRRLTAASSISLSESANPPPLRGPPLASSFLPPHSHKCRRLPPRWPALLLAALPPGSAALLTAAFLLAAFPAAALPMPGLPAAAFPMPGLPAAAISAAPLRAAMSAAACAAFREALASAAGRHSTAAAMALVGRVPIPSPTTAVGAYTATIRPIQSD